MAVTASFNPGTGVLTVIGDGLDNSIVISRNAAGGILVNGGAVAILGGTPTVANTARIDVFGENGNDTLTLDESNGALPAAIMRGGAGNDVVTGGSGNDQLFGDGGDDILLGKGGFDELFGGGGNDVLTGGDADDQVFGEAGNDRMIWNPGDDTDLNEGADASDTTQINGGNGAEVFTVTANGTRVRFDRLDPAPFSIDIGTTEKLVVNLNGGDDSFSATGNLAALIGITVDGGTGNDTILGGNGIDTLLGGDGNDFIDGQQGNDTAFLGAGDDVFQWDPGDGSDKVEGQDGTDTLLFNGSGGAEIFALSANGQRARFTRDLGNIVMDLDGVEIVTLNALGLADTLTVNDLSSTDVTQVNVDLAATIGGTAGDGAADVVTVNATNAVNTIDVFGAGTAVSVLGLAAQVAITNAEGANDSLVINGLGGNDGITATTLPAGIIHLTLDGGTGNDTLLGSQGADTFLGGDGNDFVFGDNGNDVAFLGAGNDVFQWDPGDGNDTVEGQDGADTMLFFGSNIAESIDIAANGGRVVFFRDIASVTMDLDDTETIDFRALGGNDTVVVHDLSGTDVTKVKVDLAASVGGGDGLADRVIVDGTTGADAVTVTSQGGVARVGGLAVGVDVVNADALDSLVIDALAGADVITVDNPVGTGLGTVQVDLSDDDGEADQVVVNATDGANALTVSSLGAVVSVDGLAVSVDVIDAEASLDVLTVNGLEGSDTIDAGALAAGLIKLAIDAGAGNDVVTGSLGADTVLGGIGDDRVIDRDFVNFDVHDGGAGIDTIDYSTIAFGDGVVTINLATGQTSVGVTGGSTEIIVNFEKVEGSQGGETIVGSAANNVLDGNDGNDVIRGGAGNDTIDGGNGNDSLDGGAGADAMRGGFGDDTYTVDSAGDTVIELAGQGTDAVLSFISLVLASNVENLTLAGGANLNGTGNTLANTLVGNAGDNTLDGKAGADTMDGGSGDDTYLVDNAADVVIEAPSSGTDKVLTTVSYALTAGQRIESLSTANAAATTALQLTGNEFANALTGNAGNNLLDGLGGGDAMTGGAGNDIYVVDSNGDVVTELAGGGTDTVQASISETLANNVENLTLTGANDIDGTGNTLANTLLGNAGNNLLDGKAGADAMKGGAGDDTYVVDNAGDAITELAGQGTDLVRASVSHTLANNVENLTLTGGANTNATGNTLDNRIVGNAGANIIAGKAGNDVLTGGAGQDAFLLDTALNALTNVDTLTDFNVAADTIRLDRSVFTAFANTGQLAAGAFRLGTAAVDADDRIIYDAATHDLFYDRDGTGGAAQVQIAHFDTNPALTNADFLIVA